jgi:hydroxymethylglutaryl-CoA lyase
MRNTHKTIAESLVTLQEILEVADKSNKEVVAYLSMGFGNLWRSMERRNRRWVDWEIILYGVKILSLSDTV